MKCRKVILALGLVLAACLTSTDTLAAGKKGGKNKKSEKKVSETSGAASVSETFSVQGKKSAVFCGGPIKTKYMPGSVMKNGKFLSFSKRLSNIKKMKKEAGGKKLAKLKKSEAKFKKLNKEAKGLCVKSAGVAPPGTEPNSMPVNLL